MSYYDIAGYLLAHTSYRPEVGIICGSGLSGLSSNLTNVQSFPYSSIPGFPKASVQGHTGELVFGLLNNIPCICLRGRFHFYEGHAMDTVALPVRVMRLLGVKLLLVTNAAGGLNSEYKVGDIAIIRDHFACPFLAGNNPLRGANDDDLGPRFPAMSDVYSPELIAIISDCAEKLNLQQIVRRNATYSFVGGPCYESVAEARFLRSVGGDMVGMSTVPEVVVAKHCGLAVVGLSLITNKVLVSYDEASHASHEEVLDSVKMSGRNMELLVKAFVTRENVGRFLAELPAAPSPAFVARKVEERAKARDAAVKDKEGSWRGLLLATAAATVIIGAAFVALKSSRRS